MYSNMPIRETFAATEGAGGPPSFDESRPRWLRRSSSGRWRLLTPQTRWSFPR
jgi:hypothetical protein